MRGRLLALALAVVALLGVAPGAQAASAAEVDRLWVDLQMPQILAVMREEGLAYGATLDADMLAGTGGSQFAAAVAAAYDPARMEQETRAAFGRALQAADLEATFVFVESPLGARVVQAELDARRSMLDPGVEHAARDAAAQLPRLDAPRYRLLRNFVEANDLIEANVAGALNANYAFFRGMAEGGAVDGEMDDGDILQEVWAQEPAVREDTESWMMAFVLLAYRTLADDDLVAYTAFSRGPAGREMNRALFTAFDALFLDVSHRLGLAVAQELGGQDL